MTSLSSKTEIFRRQSHLIAAIGTIARSAPAKFGPHLNSLAPFVFAAAGEDGIVN